MARINNTKRQVVIKSMAIVENAVHGMNKALKQEVDNSGELDTTFQSTRDADAKQNAVRIIKVMRWLKEDFFNIGGQTPAAFTDAEMEAIDPDVLTHEDGA